MKDLKFAVLAGDGIGPEVMEAALEVLDVALGKAGYRANRTNALVGGAAIDATGTALPEATLQVCREHDAILFGSVGGPKWESLPPAEQPERAALLPLRKAFSLFANIRPGLLYPELTEASPLKTSRIPNGIDMVCIRELTGGIYFGEKGRKDNGNTAFDTNTYTREEIERILKLAYEFAGRRRKKLTVISDQ